MAKYHEIGRFAINGDEQKVDWDSALYHEEHAADLGVPEAVVTMSKIYLSLPHDVLVSSHLPASVISVSSNLKSHSSPPFVLAPVTDAM